jgi:hypothetical protein
VRIEINALFTYRKGSQGYALMLLSVYQNPGIWNFFSETGTFIFEMIMILHRIAGFLLLLSHSLFLIRSWILLKNDRRPLQFDRWMMTLSQILIPLTILTAIPVLSETGALHFLLSLMPLIMMLILSRRSLRRQRPLLLPLVNGIFIAAAFLTGIML